MAKRAVKNVLPMPQQKDEAASVPRSLAIASSGVNTGGQFAMLMSTLMSDLIDGRITPSVGNAVCNAGGKLLKVVEMQQRWGTQKFEGGPRDLTLTVGVGKAG
jgi:hypothetical protein